MIFVRGFGRLVFEDRLREGRRGCGIDIPVRRLIIAIVVKPTSPKIEVQTIGIHFRASQGLIDMCAEAMSGYRVRC